MKPERPIKGGYILISLGLVPLVALATLSLDYERITKTKKHIVLTGIKVADTIMPDVSVEPIFGNGTITFSDVYGYDIVVSSNGSASVSEHASMDGKYVRKINAPTSNVLTDEQIAIIEEGCFINGTFLTYKNPILMPIEGSGTIRRGFIISGNTIRMYSLNTTDKTIALVNESTKVATLGSINSFNGKNVPNYPADSGTFVLKCVNGTLTWVAEE